MKEVQQIVSSELTAGEYAKLSRIVLANPEATVHDFEGLLFHAQFRIKGEANNAEWFEAALSVVESWTKTNSRVELQRATVLVDGLTVGCADPDRFVPELETWFRGVVGEKTPTDFQPIPLDQWNERAEELLEWRTVKVAIGLLKRLPVRSDVWTDWLDLHPLLP